MTEVCDKRAQNIKALEEDKYNSNSNLIVACSFQIVDYAFVYSFKVFAHQGIGERCQEAIRVSEITKLQYVASSNLCEDVFFTSRVGSPSSVGCPSFVHSLEVQDSFPAEFC